MGDCRGLACATVALSIFVSWLLAELYNIERTGSPEDGAGAVATYTFWWVTPTLRRRTPRANSSRTTCHSYRRMIARHVSKNAFVKFGSTLLTREASLLVTLLYSIQKRVLISTLLHGWAFLGLMFLDPIILKKTLRCRRQRTTNRKKLRLRPVSRCLHVPARFVHGSLLLWFCTSDEQCKDGVALAVFAKALRHESQLDSGSLTKFDGHRRRQAGAVDLDDVLSGPVELCCSIITGSVYCMYNH